MCRRDRNAWSYHSHICCWISNCFVKLFVAQKLYFRYPFPNDWGATIATSAVVLVMFVRSLQAPARGLHGDLKHSLPAWFLGWFSRFPAKFPGCLTSSPRSHADFTLSSRVLTVSHPLLFRCNPILPASSDAETFSSQIAEQELAVFWFLHVSKQRSVKRTGKPRVQKPLSDQEWGCIEMSTGGWEALTVGVKIPRTRVLTKLSRDLLSIFYI